MSTTEVSIKCATAPNAAACVRVSTCAYKDTSLFDGMATVNLFTGACGVQTYATRAELSDLILALQLARYELDAQMSPTQLVTDWAAA